MHANREQAIAKSHDEQESESLLASGLAQLGIGAEELSRFPKGSAEKVALATAIKQCAGVTDACAGRATEGSVPELVGVVVTHQGERR